MGRSKKQVALQERIRLADDYRRMDVEKMDVELPYVLIHEAVVSALYSVAIRDRVRRSQFGEIGRSVILALLEANLMAGGNKTEVAPGHEWFSLELRQNDVRHIVEMRMRQWMDWLPKDMRSHRFESMAHNITKALVVNREGY